MNFLLHAIHNDNNISRVPTNYKLSVLNIQAKVCLKYLVLVFFEENYYKEHLLL